jgi:hypothetical protein
MTAYRTMMTRVLAGRQHSPVNRRKAMRVAVFGLLIALAGCAVGPVPSRQAVSMTVPFSEADFQPWAGTGGASIRGQAFLKTVGGDAKTCAGQEIGLTHFV